MRNLEQETTDSSTQITRVKLSRKKAYSGYSSEDVDFQPTKRSKTSETSDESNKIDIKYVTNLFKNYLLISRNSNGTFSKLTDYMNKKFSEINSKLDSLLKDNGGNVPTVVVRLFIF